MANVQVDTKIYEFVHGKKPRGNGRWWFDGKHGGTDFQVCFAGTYTEAKNKAVAWAKERNIIAIKVGS